MHAPGSGRVPWGTPDTRRSQPSAGRRLRLFARLPRAFLAHDSNPGFGSCHYPLIGRERGLWVRVIALEMEFLTSPSHTESEDDDHRCMAEQAGFQNHPPQIGSEQDRPTWGGAFGAER
jgi:hypothetical protein